MPISLSSSPPPILGLCPPLRPLTTLIAWDLIGPSHPAIRLRLLWALWPHESACALLLPHESAHSLLPSKPLADNPWSSQLLQQAGVCCSHLIYHAHLALLIAAGHAAFHPQQQQQQKGRHNLQQQQLSPDHHPQHQVQQQQEPQLHASTNAARVWSPKDETIRVLSPKSVARMVREADPLVARLALELLQVQPPLHVLLSLGSDLFRPGEIIQLLQAQPGAGDSMVGGGASGRDWDVELLHMLFGAQAAETAVHAMAGSGRGGEGKGGDGTGGVQHGAAEAMRAVVLFEHHAARVTTAARKIWMGYTVRSLLLAASNPPSTTNHTRCFSCS
ncbi:unnamed protein product [Closterium sp. NIES-53]